MDNKILVTRSSMPPIEEYIEEIRSMWDTHWLTNMGPKHNEFAKELRDYLEVPIVELVTNGHMALELSLQAMDLKGDVLTTPFTFASTTHAIVRTGLNPVFCDINEDDYTIDVDELEKKLTKDTCAILPVHVYGNICNIEAIDDFAKKHGLRVIYDAAHTFGEKYKGQSVATFGDASCYSFHATKVFNSIEGGCVCLKDEELRKKVYYLKDFGIHDEELILGVGANAKMNEFCAAFGICNLRHLSEEIDKRRKVYERYIELLDGISGIRLNKASSFVESNYAYFPVVFDERVLGFSRDYVYEKLLENGINARKYFYPITNAFPCYSGRFNPSDTEVALRISKQVLTLPMYSDLLLSDVDRICRIIRGLIK